MWLLNRNWNGLNWIIELLWYWTGILKLVIDMDFIGIEMRKWKMICDTDAGSEFAYRNWMKYRLKCEIESNGKYEILWLKWH